MIPNKGNSAGHYFAVKKYLYYYIKETSSHEVDSYCLNCFYSFSTENKLKSHGEVCQNKDFCRVEMPSEENNTLKSSQVTKLEKMPYIIYADLECLVKRIEGCANNPQKSSTIKIGEHIPCGYSMLTIWGFKHIKKKHTFVTWKKLYEKVIRVFKKTWNKNNQI